MISISYLKNLARNKNEPKEEICQNVSPVFVCFNKVCVAKSSKVNYSLKKY